MITQVAPMMAPYARGREIWGGQKGEIDQPNQTMHAMSLGQVVSMLALYTDDPISNPAEACKMLFEKDENKK